MRQKSYERGQGTGQCVLESTPCLGVTLQAEISILGQLALDSTDVRSLMQTITERVAATLHVPLCKVLRCSPDGKALVLEAGVGWHDGLVGQARVPAGDRSQAGYTLLSDHPVVVSELSTETRFSGPPLLTEHGVVAGVSVIIGGVDHAFGVLGAHTPKPRSFSKDEISFLQSVAHLLASALRRRDAEERAARLAAIIEASPDFIGVAWPNGRVRYENTAFRAVVGTDTNEDLSHLRIADHHPSWAYDLIMNEGIPTAMRTGVWVGETAVRRIDGSDVPVSQLIIAHRGTDGAVEFVSTIMRDISELKRFERELSTKNKLLEAISDAQSQFIADPDVNTTFDRMLTDLFKLSDSEYGFIGEVLFDDDGTPFLKTRAITNIAWDDETRSLYAAHARDGIEFRNLHTLFGRVMTTRAPVIANDVPNDPRAGGTPDGYPPMKAFLGLPFFNAGVLVGMVGIANRPNGYDDAVVRYLQPFLDVCARLVFACRETREKERTAMELQERDKQLQHAARVATLGEMATGIAHELVQPLSAIANYANSALSGLETGDRSNDRMHMLLNRIVEQVERTASVIKGLSRFAAGKTPNRVATDIARVVHHAVGLIALDLRARQVSMNVTCDTDLPRLDVDPVQVEQIIVNLARNSLDALQESPVGRPTIVIGVRRDGSSAVDISVADSGPGIPESHFEQVFNPFVTTKEEGLGMGLAISRTIAEANGGRLYVAHERDGITVFHLKLPLPKGETATP